MNFHGLFFNVYFLFAAIVFSLSKLSYLMGFEDNYAAGEFCQMHGLNFDINTGLAIFKTWHKLVNNKIPWLDCRSYYNHAFKAIDILH